MSRKKQAAYCKTSVRVFHEGKLGVRRFLAISEPEAKTELRTAAFGTQAKAVSRTEYPEKRVVFEQKKALPFSAGLRKRNLLEFRFGRHLSDLQQPGLVVFQLLLRAFNRRGGVDALEAVLPDAGLLQLRGFEGDGHQLFASLKGAFPDLRDLRIEGKCRQHLAALEGLVLDRHDSDAALDGLQLRASLEGALADGLHVLSDGYLLELLQLIAGLVRDGGNLSSIPIRFRAENVV